MAGDETGALAEQKIDHGGNFIGLTEPPNRQAAFEHFAGVVKFFRCAAGAQQRRVDGARADAVDAYAVRRKLETLGDVQ